MTTSRFDRFRSFVSHTVSLSQLDGGGCDWTPKKGDKVKVIFASNEYERKFIGKIGTITRGCGSGVWKVKYPGEGIANLRIASLEKVPE
jgi:hypothetical protein